jgi:hypothetical protein
MRRGAATGSPASAEPGALVHPDRFGRLLHPARPRHSAIAMTRALVFEATQDAGNSHIERVVAE